MANNNRFADAIRRIVEPLIPEKSGDALLPGKGDIEGRRGVGYATSTGAVAGATGAVGQKLTPAQQAIVRTGGDAAADAAANAALDALGATAASQGSYDADDILDGEDGPLDPDTDSSNSDVSKVAGSSENQSGTSSGGSRLLELTGLKKCGDTSGKEYTVRLDGNYIPPEGWETAENPPEQEYWQLGYYWVTSGSTPGATPGEAADEYMAFLRATNPGTYGTAYWDTSTLTPVSGTPPAYTSFTYTWYVSPGGTAVPGTSVTRSICPGPSPDLCPIVNPTAKYWPFSNNPQLTMNSSGQFVPSQYDREVDTEYSTPRSTLSMCTSSGQPMQITPLKNGGFALYKTSGGAPTGTVQLYNSDKSKAGYTDGTGLLALKP